MEEQVKTPLLSVIIPVYNAVDYIEQCLNSIKGGGVSNVEILCVDDGSTDGSLELLGRYARENPRIHVIRQEHKSAGAARNNGLSLAKGEFIHFLDADDRVCPGAYCHAIGRLEQMDADVCMFQYLLYNNCTGRETKCPCLLNREDTVTGFSSSPAFFLYNMEAPWNKVYRRSWIVKHGLRFDEILCANDRGFYFRMLAAGGRITLSQNYGVSYRVNNAASLTGTNRWRHFDCLFYAWDSAILAVAKESPEARAMTLDCVVRDTLDVFQRMPAEPRPQVLTQLQQWFLQTDLSVIDALPFPCVWKEDVALIREGKNPYDNPRRLRYQIRKQVAACKIWGIRGRIIKLLARFL